MSTGFAGSQPKVGIIGAGIAGLTLACRLQAKQIPFSIYEARDADTISHGYAVTITRPTIVSFSNLVSKSEEALCKTTGADGVVGGQGQVKKYFCDTDDGGATQLIDRELRQTLLKHLSMQNIEVKWKHSLTGIKPRTTDTAELAFENQESDAASLVVDTAGLRAPAFDDGMNNPPKQKTLPYAVYYGSRRVKSKDFREKLAKHFPPNDNFVEQVPESTEKPYLSIQKIHMPGGTADDHKIELRWTYSRPPRGETDKLWRPNRAPNEAKDIPNEFYEEFLSEVEQHFPQWKDFFASREALKGDRILNWHLRLRLPSKDYLEQNTKRQGYQVIAIGDAVHGLPIVKSKGTCVAEKDAEVLADAIMNNQLENFYASSNVYNRWFLEAVEALQGLRKLHGQQELSQTELKDTIGFWHDTDGSRSNL
ncbi:hypothetical protein LTR66_016219 [Elasticomyces elasticus]|nr:hypothetical protein LTR66_016219 [Elasticomyces elasticus]